MSSRFTILCRSTATLAVVLAPAPAFAYVGPGAGITAIGSVLALLMGVLIAIVGFIWYPLKRFLRSRSGRSEAGAPTAKDTAEKHNSREDAGAQ
jgi:hypothetical protein